MLTAHTVQRFARSSLKILFVAAFACAGENETPEPATAAAGVRITAPNEGFEATGAEIEIILATDGIEVVPAGTVQANSGHHHLFVGTDLSPVGEPIPAGQDGIIHMGDGSTRYLLQNLAPGEHRVIAVLGDHVHVRLPVATDTVIVVVP